MTVSTLSKVMAGFLSLFMVQCVFFPDFLMKTNFHDYEIDQFHYFLMRMMGILGGAFCYLLVKIDSEEYLAFQTAVIVAFGMSGPVFAHFNLPVNLPDHYFPFVGFCALMVVHVYTLATATEGKTKKS